MDRMRGGGVFILVEEVGGNSSKIFLKKIVMTNFKRTSKN